MTVPVLFCYVTSKDCWPWFAVLPWQYTQRVTNTISQYSTSDIWYCQSSIITFLLGVWINERLDLLKNNYEILMRYWKLNKLWKQTFDMCALSLGTLAEWRPYSTRKMLFCNFRTLLCVSWMGPRPVVSPCSCSCSFWDLFSCHGDSGSFNF